MANDEVKQEVPEVEGAFTTLLKKFGVGLKGGITPETVAENISRTGGEFVFEIPERLAERLATWHEHISPVKRKQILEQWFAEKNIEIPEEAIKVASIKTTDIRKRGEEEEKKKEEEEKRKAKFFVDTDSGQIRAAKEGERALTWDEAEKVADRIKKERPKDDKAEKEPAFLVGEQGAWTLNPKAKIGFGEFAVFQMYQDSLKKGEPIDPVEELARREEASVRLKEAMGFKTGGEDTEMTMLDKLDKLGMLKKSEGGEGALLSQLDSLGLLRKPGEEGRAPQLDMLEKLNQLGMLKKTGQGEGGEGALLSQLDSLGLLRKPGEEGRAPQLDMLEKLNQLGMLKKTGQGEGGEGALLSQLDSLGLLRKPGEEGRAPQLDMLDKINQLGLLKKPGEEDAGSQTMRALETQVKELRESLQKQEMDTVKNAVISLSNQMNEMRKEMSTQGRLEGRYALMEKTITTIDSQLTGLRSDARPLLDTLARGGGREPSKKSPEEKAKIAKGLKEAVALEQKARALEDELLFGGKPQG